MRLLETVGDILTKRQAFDINFHQTIIKLQSASVRYHSKNLEMGARTRYTKQAAKLTFMSVRNQWYRLTLAKKKA